MEYHHELIPIEYYPHEYWLVHISYWSTHEIQHDTVTHQEEHDLHLGLANHRMGDGAMDWSIEFHVFLFRLTFAGLTGFLKYTGDGMVASIPSIPSRFTQDTLTQLLLFAEAFAWTGGASSIEVGLQPWLPMASSRHPVHSNWGISHGHDQMGATYLIFGYRNRSHSIT